ncbi:hypothetical protein [Nocardioides sp.]|uniref:SHOCT domain-containing protein n=1 Tax=Nocardioides sp. TaxID=35761 RepID=UPI00286B1CFB|nr:hypothetical protein [Nocardioides sp.]
MVSAIKQRETAMMYWSGDGGWADSGAGYVLMVLGMVLFWGAIVAAFVFVLRQPSRQDHSARGMVAAHRTAQQVLAERFARGEIDKTEFESRSATLHGQSPL